MNNRNATRIQIPGTTVHYHNITKKMFLQNIFSNKSELINLSKSGASFCIVEQLTFGEKLMMKFFFPDGNIYKLAGHVRWSKGMTNNLVFNIGVLFNPFGKGKGYNSPIALEYFKIVHKLDKVIIEKKDETEED